LRFRGSLGPRQGCFQDLSVVILPPAKLIVETRGIFFHYLPVVCPSPTHYREVVSSAELFELSRCHGLVLCPMASPPRTVSILFCHHYCVALTVQLAPPCHPLNPQELNKGGIQSRDHPPRSTPRLRYRHRICTEVEERGEQYSYSRTPAPAGHEDRNEGGHTLRQLTRRSLQLLVLQIPCLMPHDRGRMSRGSVKSQAKLVIIYRQCVMLMKSTGFIGQTNHTDVGKCDSAHFPLRWIQC